MKVALIFLSLFALTLCLPSNNDNRIPIVLDEDHDISSELFKGFLEKLANSKADDTLTAIINEYVDRLFVNIDKFMINQGLDPFALPDERQTVGALIFKGELALTNGTINDLSTIYRGGDAVVRYLLNSKNTLTVVVPIAFKDLSFKYHYSAKFMHLGPTGSMEGKIRNLKVQVTISFDFNKYHAILDQFHIVNSGHIDLNFSGNVLTDWILNLFIDVATTILKQLILLIMDNIIKVPINNIIDMINSVLDAILNTTTTPATAFLA